MPSIYKIEDKQNLMPAFSLVICAAISPRDSEEIENNTGYDFVIIYIIESIEDLVSLCSATIEKFSIRPVFLEGLSQNMNIEFLFDRDWQNVLNSGYWMCQLID